MTLKYLVRLSVSLGLFAFFFSLHAFSRPVSAQVCDAVTDKQLVTDIYAKIKADKGLAGQVRHINVVAVNRAIKLQGWVENNKDYERVIAFVSETACVKMVNVNRFESSPPTNLMRSEGGCAAGMKPCGDICIPDGDSCNIGGEGQSGRLEKNSRDPRMP